MSENQQNNVISSDDQKPPIIAWVAAIIIIGFILYVYNSAKPTESPAVINSDELTTEQHEFLYNWGYETTKDEMRGTEITIASVMSTNEVELDLPYNNGGTVLSLALREDATGDISAMVVASQGQLWCHYEDCFMSVRFDDGAVSQYAINRAEAGSSNVMFLSDNTEQFINKLKNSENTTIEVGFYGNGNKQFKFDTHGLKWPQ